ncbi:MAG: HAD family hydrolase [Desulfohalobiaceae bacterium]
MPEDLQALIFDFDGTLAELRLDFSRMRKGVLALQEAFLPQASLSEDSWPVLEKVQEIRDMLEQSQPGLGLEFASRCRLFITALEMDAAGKGRLFPYSLSILEGLQNMGLLTGIVTRNCSAAVRTVFPEVQDRCRVFLAREDVPNPKPHPDHLQAALQRLGVRSGACLMVGDHILDIQTAKACGAKSAVVATGSLGLQELLQAEPDYWAQDLPGLIQGLQKQGLLPAAGV